MSGRAVALETAVPTKVSTVWGRRRILWLLVSRDLKVKYADSAIGYFWSVLEPMMLAGVYWFVFTKLMNRQVGASPYIVFLLCAMLPWQFTNGAIRASMKALSKDAKLVRSTNLPREIWVLRTIGTQLVEFLLSLPVLALFAVLTGAHLNRDVMFFPVALAIQVVLLLGIGLILAPVAVLYTDVARLVPTVLRLLFYFSPILYGVRDIRKRLGSTAAHFYSANPLAGIIDLYRSAFFHGQAAGWHGIAAAAVTAVITLLIGLRVFSRLEGVVLKEI
jgi:ABC-2 type transport system permease protein